MISTRFKRTKALNKAFRIGFGFDTHALQPGRPLIIGGVSVESPKGAVGHSDADVLLHAICDALLGAAALGDIGTHFPDTDERYKGIDSGILLQQTMSLLRNEGYELMNVDTTVSLEAPKIRPYADEIRRKIATLLGVEIACVSVKAKTSEKMGFIGRGEGITAYAVALITA